MTLLYSKIDELNTSIDENKKITDEILLSFKEQNITISCTDNCDFKPGEYLTYSLSTPFYNLLDFEEEKEMKIYFSLLLLD